MTTERAGLAPTSSFGEHVERIDCGEVTLDCIVAGHESQPLVVLLHGFPESRYSWRNQIGPLAEYFHVVAPNLRGYGASDRPAGIASYRLDQLTGDVRGLVRKMGRDKAHIVGHDWGGAIAWALAIDDETPADRRDGRVVDKLVVLNCPHPTLFARALRSNPVQQSRSAYFGFFLLPFLPEWLLSALDFSLLRGLIGFELGDRDIDDVFGCDHLVHLRETLGSEDALNAAVNYYRAAVLYAGDLRTRYRKPCKISRPTRLIWGAEDPALDIDLTRDMDELFHPNCFRLMTIPGASHWVQQEAPQKVNHLLVEFLKGQPRRPPGSRGRAKPRSPRGKRSSAR